MPKEISMDVTCTASSARKILKTNIVKPLPPVPQCESKRRHLRRPSVNGHVIVHHLTFTQALGKSGLPLLTVVLVSIAWTIWLIILNISPNATANYLMDTAEFDDGIFWLISDPDPVMLGVVVSGSILLVLSYVYVLLKMTIWRNSQALSKPNFLYDSGRLLSSKIPYFMVLWRYWSDFTGYHGRYRKIWNLLLKAIDLITQGITLHTILEAGFPVILCYGYALLVFANCFSCVIFILSPVHFSALTEVFIDTIFDMFFAIGAPMLLLVFSINNFNFDRERFLLYLHFFSPGSFERQARMMADPSEIMFFRLCFDGLRTLSPLDFVVRMSMNFSFCYRLKRVIDVKTSIRRQKMLHQNHQLSNCAVSQAPVPRLWALAFLSLSALIVVYTHQCITFSKQACISHPQCAAYVHRWKTYDSCPCLAIIDVDQAPKTYEEWLNPVDAFETVKNLSISGDLQVLQLINRGLKTWPDELQRCTNLRQLILMYSGVETIPMWMKRFTKLEYLSIEGKSTDMNLVSMPDDLFADMASLKFFHLGLHPQLERLPSFYGLTNLKTLSLAAISSLATLPAIEPLHKLQHLGLVLLSRLSKLPDLGPAKYLKALSIYLSPVCCNGFFGECDPFKWYCASAQETCLPASQLPNEANQRIFQQYSATICNDSAIGSGSFPTKATADVCDGVMYRQCQMPGTTNNKNSNRAEARSGSSSSPSCRTPQAAASSFFIVQESALSSPHKVIQPGGNQPVEIFHSTPSSHRKSKKLRKHASPSNPPNHNSQEDTSRQRSVSINDAPTAIYEGHEEDQEIETDTHRESPALKKKTTATLLNRVGSAPDLPLHNSVSASVYTSSQKRNLMKTAFAKGAGSHFVAMQRSRLVPLPINIRTGTLTNRASTSKSTSSPLLHSQTPEDMPQQLQEKLNDQMIIEALRVRLVEMQKELGRDLKHKASRDKHAEQLDQENQALLAENAQLQQKVAELEKTLKQQKLRYEKLSDRYTTAYANLQKLTEQLQPSRSETNTSSIHEVLQRLTRENQDYQRKLSILEARHCDDKVLLSNQEKKIKRLKAEMEALQHMNDVNTREDHSEISIDQNTKALAESSSLRPISNIVIKNTVDASRHLVSAEDYQYIDPNILKVLEKVDSQFSITNAINLSVVLKKWLNSCFHVVCSTHLPTVLQTLLTRMCELLHCEHAAIFEVDHVGRKLIGVCSETGTHRWELPLDKGILGYAARQNTVCNVQKAYDDPRFYSSTDTVTCTQSREVLCFPIVHELQPAQSHDVFAVVQAWNTTNQKPFTTNDQILGSLLTMQAGIIFAQTRVTKALQKINTKLLNILYMPDEIVDKARRHSASVGKDSSSCSIVHLVAIAQTKFAECIGTKKLKIFIFDEELKQIWHVGSQLNSDGQISIVRKYSNVLSSLCSSVLHAKQVLIVPDPVAEEQFNDTVDLKGGALGVYLAPILSPWSSSPLGMIQVARTASAPVTQSLSSQMSGTHSPEFAAAIRKETDLAQKTADELTMELIELFCRVFASILHHSNALQLYESSPPEIQNAQIVYLTDRLKSLELEYLHEQQIAEEEEARMELQAEAATLMEKRIFQSMQREKLHNYHASKLSATLHIISESTNPHRETGRRNSYVSQNSNQQASDASRRVSSAGTSRRIVASSTGGAPHLDPIVGKLGIEDTVSGTDSCGSGYGNEEGHEVDYTSQLLASPSVDKLKANSGHLVDIRGADPDEKLSDDTAQKINTFRGMGSISVSNTGSAGLSRSSSETWTDSALLDEDESSPAYADIGASSQWEELQSNEVELAHELHSTSENQPGVDNFKSDSAVHDSSLHPTVSMYTIELNPPESTSVEEDSNDTGSPNGDLPHSFLECPAEIL